MWFAFFEVIITPLILRISTWKKYIPPIIPYIMGGTYFFQVEILKYQQSYNHLKKANHITRHQMGHKQKQVTLSLVKNGLQTMKIDEEIMVIAPKLTELQGSITLMIFINPSSCLGKGPRVGNQGLIQHCKGGDFLKKKQNR